MEEEMEESTGMLTFTAIEIDADYEFDAPTYFEFTRPESSLEASQAEFWFHSAPTYPPSPFVTKMLLRKDILMENVTTSLKDKKLEIPESENSVVDQEIYAMDMSNREAEYDRMDGRICDDVKSCIQPVSFQTHCIPTGLTFYNHALDSKAKQNTTAKLFYPRTSTLMKPTASQLAKQNRSHQLVDYRNRFLKFENKEKSSFNSSTLESQAAKRQKLEGGQLRKVADTNQQTHLIHKEPRRDGNTDRNPAHAKLRITIPREPDLKTAQRAQRIRPKVNSEQEQETSNAPTFKALLLNRKILDTPSMMRPKRSTPRIPEFQEFHLKTSERAMQHNSAVPSYSVPCNNAKVLRQPCTKSTGECSNRDSIRSNVVPAPKMEEYEVAHKFKALPLNKKIFTSKGDLGVFRNSKRETTVPKEFNLHTECRAQHDPPTELFNKLTLTSELRPNTGSLFNLPRPACSSAKGSKENRVGSFQQESEVNMIQENSPRFKINQIPSLGGVTKIGSLYRTNRSSGIR